MYKATIIFSLGVLLTDSFANSAGLSTDKYVQSLLSYLNSRPGQTLSYRGGELMVINKKSDHVQSILVNVKAGRQGETEILTTLQCRAEIIENYGFLKVLEGTASCNEVKNSIQAFRPASLNGEQQPVEDIGRFLLDSRKNNYEYNPLMDVKPSVRRGVLLGNPRRHHIVSRNTDSVNEALTINQEDNSKGISDSTNDKLTEDLASLAVKHVDMHYPGVWHTLNKIVALEQQTKAFGEMQYVLHLHIDFNSCADIQDASCFETKACRVIYIRKPWLKLLDGSKYIAIHLNNCTDERLPERRLFTPKTKNLESSNEENRLQEPNLSKPGSKKEFLFLKPNYLGQNSLSHMKAKQLEGDSANKLVASRKKSLDEVNAFSKVKKSQTQNNNIFFPIDLYSDRIDNFKASKLAEESLDFVDDKHTKRIIKIHSVKTWSRQIEIIYDFGYTLCTNGVDSKCILLEDEPFHTCKAVISSQQWVEGEKKISVSCEKIKIPLRKKRQYVTMTDIPLEDKNKFFDNDPDKGTLLDVAKPEISVIVEKAISKYKEISNSAEEFKLNQIVEVTQKKKRKEDGENNRYILKFDINSQKEYLHCHAVILAPNLQSDSKMNISCMDRTVPGGLTSQDPKDYKYQEMALMALKQYSREPYNIDKIIDVKTQVVAGLITYIEYFARSDRTFFYCNSRFFKSSPSTPPQIDTKCDQVLLTDGKLRSGDITSNLNDTIQSMADQALQKYEIMTNCSSKHFVSKILSVSTVSINGNLTKIMFEMSRTNCTISDVQNCIIDQSVLPETCHAEIWEVAVLGDVNINVYCHSHNFTSISQPNLTQPVYSNL